MARMPSFERRAGFCVAALSDGTNGEVCAVAASSVRESVAIWAGSCAVLVGQGGAPAGRYENAAVLRTAEPQRGQNVAESPTSALHRGQFIGCDPHLILLLILAILVNGNQSEQFRCVYR